MMGNPCLVGTTMPDYSTIKVVVVVLLLSSDLSADLTLCYYAFPKVLGYVVWTKLGILSHSLELPTAAILNPHLGA